MQITQKTPIFRSHNAIQAMNATRKEATTNNVMNRQYAQIRYYIRCIQSVVIIRQQKTLVFQALQDIDYM